uniref:Thioredoxin domain-containing protein n=1 Tax=Anolis carolinensis TaxID=28377 RepID=A0A803SZ56_ANOCA
MMVKVIGNLVKFQSELDSTAGKLIVIDFSITWCGPCKMIKPFFYSLSKSHLDHMSAYLFMYLINLYTALLPRGLRAVLHNSSIRCHMSRKWLCE